MLNAELICIQPTQLDLARKVTRGRDDKRKDDGDLRVARREERQAFLHLHLRPEILPDLIEARAQPLVLIGLAVVQRNALGIFAHPHHRKAQV